MKKEIPKEFIELYNSLKDIYEEALSQLYNLLNVRLNRRKRVEGIRARVIDKRIKKPRKIWKKATNHEYTPSQALEEIVDILGIRIVCNNLSDSKAVIDIIKESGLLEIKEIKDMISKPMEDGYRAVHIRTLFKYNSRENKDAFLISFGLDKIALGIGVKA